MFVIAKQRAADAENPFKKKVFQKADVTLNTHTEKGEDNLTRNKIIPINTDREEDDDSCRGRS